MSARFAGEPLPRFLTVTETVGDPEELRHTDVSLWYLLSGSRQVPLRPDGGSFTTPDGGPATNWPGATR